jgi:hypothetical protein
MTTPANTVLNGIPQLVAFGQSDQVTTSWTSATAQDTALQLNITNWASIAVSINQTSTLTAGTVTFEVSDTAAGTNWYPITLVATSGIVASATYNLQPSVNLALQMNAAGFVLFRVRLSTAITGTATVNVGITGNASSAEWAAVPGVSTPRTTLNAATTTATGTVADFAIARQAATFQVVAGAGVTAGAVTFFGSLDNVTFTPLTTASILAGTTGNSITAGVLSFTAAGNALISVGAAGNNSNAIRYYRADVTTNFVGGSVTVKVSAA